MTGPTRAEYHAMLAGGMTEKQLQDAIVGLAQRLNWRAYHTHDSRRSQPGFPDLVLVRGRRTLFRELKREKGRPTSDQLAWLHDLERAGQDAAIWRPRDWFNRDIEHDLMEERRA